MASEVSKIKVRFAPSPTGIPHVGNIRTALFDYFLAKSKNGKFILRIEDTDQARKIEGAEEAIKESLLWLGASWDEYIVQSTRLNEYKKYANELLVKGFAKEDNGAIRFVVDKTEDKISWTDAVGNKEVEYLSKNVEDFIILKADGYPTYHLANVVDDHLMNITHVIRGEDWIPSTPKHILLYKAFGWDLPVFAHVPNVLGVDGKKLSKRRGAKSVIDYKKDGYLPHALLNYLMLLGWSPKDDKELLKIDEIVKEFKLENINVSPSVFDERKLQWMNGEYIRQLSKEELISVLTEFNSEFIDFLNKNNLIELLEIAKSRVKLLSDFKASIEVMLTSNLRHEDGLEIRNKLYKVLSEIKDWNKEQILNSLMNNFIKNSIKFPILYKAIYGLEKGLPLADTFEVLGKEKTLQLLK